jgi:hypothetical protein
MKLPFARRLASVLIPAMTLHLVLSSINKCAAADPEPVPFPLDWGSFNKSVIDLTRFLDAPAGQHGRLMAQDGHFVAPNGKRVRLWGVNTAIDMCFPDEEQAPQLAADLAKLGFNVVRFHHIDTDWGKSLIDPNQDDTQKLDAIFLRKFDRMFYELKQRGIYSIWTMNIHRKLKSGDKVRDNHLLGVAKGATYFNPRLIELEHAFTRAILMHENPFTKMTYAADPSIIGIELLNENSLYEAWVGWRLRHGVVTKADDTWQPIPDSYATELDWLYYNYLKQFATADQLATIAKETGVSFQQKPDRLPNDFRLTPDRFADASQVRFSTEANFIGSIETSFFENYRKLIRDELRCNALLTLSNDHNDSISGYPHLRSNLKGDWIDGHGYWEHPSIGVNTKSKNTPMVNEPLDSTLVQFARSPALGVPFTIGEVNHPFPHRYAAEGYAILSMYSQMHDWDGIVWFDWEKGRLDGEQTGIHTNGWFDLSRDPIKISQLVACGYAWHRHDVASAKETHIRAIEPSAIHETLRNKSHRPFFAKGFDLTTPLRRSTRFTLNTRAEPSSLGEGDFPERTWDKPPLSILSDSGQLTWSNAHLKQGLVRINTSHTCGVIGFVKAHWWKSECQTEHLEIEPENDHCSVLLTSMDDQPLSSSNEMLLTAGGRSANTQQAWRDDWQTLAHWGEGPVTIVPVKGRVKLKNLQAAKSVVAVPLSPLGVPSESSIEAEWIDGNWQWKVGEIPTTWWKITVRR